MGFEGREMSFEEADRRYADLKRSHEARDINNEQFGEQLKQLMVRDDEGRWWAKSRRTGEWHYSDGDGWRPGTPPNYEPPPRTPRVETEAESPPKESEQVGSRDRAQDARRTPSPRPERKGDTTAGSPLTFNFVAAFAFYVLVVGTYDAWWSNSFYGVNTSPSAGEVLFFLVSPLLPGLWLAFLAKNGYWALAYAVAADVSFYVSFLVLSLVLFYDTFYLPTDAVVGYAFLVGIAGAVTGLAAFGLGKSWRMYPGTRAAGGTGSADRETRTG